MDEPWYTESGSEVPLLGFEAAQLPTKSVAVYSDRAEVKRVVIADLVKGTNEILIQNVSAVIERQSVRVDAVGAMIQEVQYQEMAVDAETETEKVRCLEATKLELETLRLSMEDECSSLRKRIDVLDGVAAQIAAGSSGASTMTPESSPHSSIPNMGRRHTITAPSAFSGSLLGASSMGFLMNEDALCNLAKFLQYYGDTVSQMKSDLRSKQRECEAVTEKVDTLERQIDQLRCGYEYDSVKRNISIIVEMETAASVELLVTYQVYCAGWKPAYDIRANSAGEGENSVKLCYYGLVEQNTGDDWKDAELVLSTATPSVGGCAPQLSTLAATLHKPHNQRSRNASARRKPMSAVSEEDMGFGSFDYNEMADAAALHRYNTGQLSRSSEENSVTTPCAENVVSTCFSIPRAVTIRSNGTEHKVLVAMTDLASAFSHESVPSRCAAAFLSASITNTSTFPLLPGPANVYLNNSFVAKTHLRVVIPGDEFRCSLGMDPSIKVEYKNPTTSHEQVGFMSKSMLVTHEQIIHVRNAKVGQTVQLTIKEQIPKSADEKIKISVVAPELRGKDASAKLNKDHNLEWTCVLAAGQSKDLAIRYTVEHPANESVSFRLVV